ncbi:hypothetical protein JXB22_02410 [candidate division WOR-3 bacterium]|nr:hypothetical protein [candidate division WOR-3 bacterium]
MIPLILVFFTQINIATVLQPKYRNEKLTIGDPFAITVSITRPIDMAVSEPFVDSLGPFMILDQTSKTVQKKGSVLTTYDIRLAAFTAGNLELPGFRVTRMRGDTIDTITGNVIPLTIQSVMPEDMTDINDIKKAVEFPNFLPLIIAGIVIGCVLLAYAAYRIIRTIVRTRATETPLLPPWIEALAAIDTIPVQEWLGKGLIKKYYYALSEILKRYIERRFVFNAAEQTTSELVATMKAKQIPLRDEFHHFFQRADMVKYAKLIPGESEIRTAVHTAKDLVNQTTPQEQGSAQ